jgi:hypothetical protein
MLTQIDIEIDIETSIKTGIDICSQANTVDINSDWNFSNYLSVSDSRMDLKETMADFERFARFLD